MSGWTNILIWATIVVAVFAYLWWQGQIRRLAGYVRETWAELEKCAWPSWTELRGSTALIMVTIALMGSFVFVVDQMLYFVFFKL